MLILLSPAKKMNLAPMERSVEASQPRMNTQAQTLAKIAKQQSPADLKSLMRISDDLANLNAERFQAFALNGRSNSAKPAIFTFDGDVYWGLDAKTFSDDDLDFAQDHVRILSGLYGVLRPLDSIQPYRLEMGTKLKNPRGDNLYTFWGDSIAKTLNADDADQADRTIVNLASNEYFKAVDQKTLDAPVLNFSFLNIKDGKARSLMYYAKFARGLMARWVVQNRIEKADDLRGFDLEGYRYDKATSTADKLVFARQQPPPKNG